MAETKQKKITDPTNPNQLPKKLELTQPPNPTSTPTPAKPKQPLPQMPKETRILCDFLEELEGAAYHARQTLYQQYGPVEYKPITNIELEFTEEQNRILTYSEEGEYHIIKLKVRAEPAEFAAIAQRVRDLGGQYISAGKNTHFKVRKD